MKGAGLAIDLRMRTVHARRPKLFLIISAVT